MSEFLKTITALYFVFCQNFWSEFCWWHPKSSRFFFKNSDRTFNGKQTSLPNYCFQRGLDIEQKDLDNIIFPIKLTSYDPITTILLRYPNPTSVCQNILGRYFLDLDTLKKKSLLKYGLESWKVSFIDCSSTTVVKMTTFWLLLLGQTKLCFYTTKEGNN